LSRDPVESEPPYAYVHGNSVNLTDPSGYQAEGVLVTTCTLALPACGAAATVAAVTVGVVVIIAGPFVIIEAYGDFAAQHPELVWRPKYGPGPAPETATPISPPYIGPTPPACYWSADGCKPVSAIPESQPGSEPEPRPAPKPRINIDIWPCPDDDDNSHQVLTVGDGNFGYSNSLYSLHPDWKVTATNYGNGSNSQDYVGGYGNLAQYTNVDATRLGSGRITGNNRYDAIIFNNPAVTTADDRVDGSQTARLISSFRRSAYSVLAPGGEIHINVTQSLLLNYPEIYPRLGLPDNMDSTLKNLPRFGQSRYYAPYTPYYSSGKTMQYYRYNRTNVRIMLNFVYR